MSRHGGGRASHRRVSEKWWTSTRPIRCAPQDGDVIGVGAGVVALDQVVQGGQVVGEAVEVRDDQLLVQDAQPA